MRPFARGQTGILISLSRTVSGEDPGVPTRVPAACCMGFLLTLPIRLLLWLIQRLPLRLVVHLGRGLGALGWLVLRRHRRVALENLTAVFGTEKSPAVIRDLARENFRRLGENYLCGIHTSTLSDAEIGAIVEFRGLENLPTVSPQTLNLIFATGHFGNFELCGRVQRCLPGWQLAGTYRALQPPALNDLLQELRGHSGCRFFERTRDAQALRQCLSQGGIALGLFADQHAGVKGLWVPFFGRPCSTSASVVILAQRYHSPVCSLVCYRTGPGRWTMEFGASVPTRNPDGSLRQATTVMREVNAQYEAAIRRDPANWFWVHRRWKPPTEQQLARAKADGLGETPAADS